MKIPEPTRRKVMPTDTAVQAEVQLRAESAEIVIHGLKQLYPNADPAKIREAAAEWACSAPLSLIYRVGEDSRPEPIAPFVEWALFLGAVELRRVQVEHGLSDEWAQGELVELEQLIATNWPKVFQQDNDGGYDHAIFSVESPDGTEIQLGDFFEEALRALR
jgi:hypothetical protein